MDHKFIDDQPKRFDSESLRRLKRAHEDWVRLALGVREASQGEARQPVFARRLQTGADVASLLGGVEAYEFDNDAPRSEDEIGVIGSFLQSVHDWGEIWGDIEPSSRVEAQYSITQELRALEEAGFVVFGTTLTRYHREMRKKIPLQTASIRVLRLDSPDIIDLTGLTAFGKKGSSLGVSQKGRRGFR